MNATAAAGAAFLFAVLWFDMMFDGQTRKYPRGPLPADALASISAYYRRVTIEARPMIYLPVVVMLLVLAAIVLEVVKAAVVVWAAGLSLALAIWAVGSVAFIAVPRAQRIGRAREPAETLSDLARTVFRLHAIAAVCLIVVIVLQLLA